MPSDETPAEDDSLSCSEVVQSWSWSAGEPLGFDSQPNDTGFTNPWAFGLPTGGCLDDALPCWATGLIGEYGNCQAGVVLSPQLDLTPCLGTGHTLELRFHHRYTFEEPSGEGRLWDGGSIQFSSDGGTNWNDAMPLPDYDGPLDGNYSECDGRPELAEHPVWSGEMEIPRWEEVSVPIPDELRSNAFQFRWIFASDRGVTEAGWVVDSPALALNTP